MKKIITLLCLMAIVLSTRAQDSYTIKGTVTSAPKDKQITINLFYTNEAQKFIRDTCDLVNGQFQFKGTVGEPHSAFLSMTINHENFMQAFPAFRELQKNVPPMVQIPFFLEKADITAKWDYATPEDAVITGGMNNEAFQQLRPILNKYKKQEAALLAKAKSSVEDKFEQNIKDIAMMNEARRKEIGAVIKKYPAAVVNGEMLTRYFSPMDNLEQAKLHYSYLSPELKQSKKVMKYELAIKSASSVENGAQAPGFTLPDTSGKEQKLSNFKGKYVLLDFWASWCVPCRKETPKLISLYQNYKNKNFEIVSVSLDGELKDSRKLWTDAIKNDKMTWTQLSDLKGFTSFITLTYVIKSIPMNYLIDPKGKIIARNLHGKELEDTLKKYL